MKKSKVRVGNWYIAKVSGKLVTVAIQSTMMTGGWHALNLATGRKLRIRGAQRLRREAKEEEL